MNKRLLWMPIRQERMQTIGLLLCSVLFVCGCLIGVFAAGLVNNTDMLGNTLKQFMDRSSDQPMLTAALFDAFKYHLSAIFLGFSLLGVVCIPILSAVRGFFLSFSISVVVRLLGGKGIVLTLAMFGVQTLISIPCFFILAVLSFNLSQHFLHMTLAKNNKVPALPTTGRILIICLLCFALLFVSALIDTYLTPQLIHAAAAHISF